MGKKLFIGNLSWNIDDDGLQQAFEKFGSMEEVRVIKDRETGRSRGFGFITFAEEESAQNAISEMDGADLDGRTIKVNEAQDKPRGGGRGGRGGGGGGNRW